MPGVNSTDIRLSTYCVPGPGYVIAPNRNFLPEELVFPGKPCALLEYYGTDHLALPSSHC